MTVNSTMLHQFESTLTGHCPEECEQQYFEPVINSDAMIDSRTANRFGALRTQDIAVIEMRYLRTVSALLKQGPRNDFKLTGSKN